MATMRQARPGRAVHGRAPARLSASRRGTKREGADVTSDRVLEVAARHLDQFVSLESKVLKGNKPEAIHDIRVASRRLQQVFDLIYPLPRAPRVRKLRRTIRRSRRVLSLVRNCDVLLDRTERVLARKQTSRREAWEAFRDYLRERREQSFRRASRRLGKLNLSAFYVRLKEQLRSDASPSNPPAAQDASPAGENELSLRGRLGQELMEAWSALEGGVGEAQERPGAAALHSVRIAAKKVRYLIEVIHELEVSECGQALACLRRLQQRLGDWHDLEILEEMLLEMVARPAFLRGRLELAMEVERLVLRNRRSKKAHEKEFFHMTQDSEEWKRLTDWVQGFLAADSAHAGRDRKEAHSPVLPPRA